MIKGLLRDCLIFVNLCLTFVSSSSIYGPVWCSADIGFIQRRRVVEWSEGANWTDLIEFPPNPSLAADHRHHRTQEYEVTWGNEPFSPSVHCVYTQLQSPVLAAWMTDAVCVGMGSNISNINVSISQSMQHIIFCILPPLHSLFSQTQARIAPGINDGPKHEYADTKDDM